MSRAKAGRASVASSWGFGSRRVTCASSKAQGFFQPAARSARMAASTRGSSDEIGYRFGHAGSFRRQARPCFACHCTNPFGDRNPSNGRSAKRSPGVAEAARGCREAVGALRRVVRPRLSVAATCRDGPLAVLRRDGLPLRLPRSFACPPVLIRPSAPSRPIPSAPFVRLPACPDPPHPARSRSVRSVPSHLPCSHPARPLRPASSRFRPSRLIPSASPARSGSSRLLRFVLALFVEPRRTRLLPPHEPPASLRALCRFSRGATKNGRNERLWQKRTRRKI